MAASSSKSSTLPANLKYGVASSDENESFFAKLKKKFKLKKGKYHIDVNIDECANVSAVSFKKRDSSEVPEPTESRWHINQQYSSMRETRSQSPKLSKKASRSQSCAKSDQPGSTQFLTLNKHCNPESHYFALKNSFQIDNSVVLGGSENSKLSSKVKNYNEYRPLNYDTKDHLNLIRTDTIYKEDDNKCLLESAVDIGNEATAKMNCKYFSKEDGLSNNYHWYEVKRAENDLVKEGNEDKLNNILDPLYDSVHDFKRKTLVVEKCLDVNKSSDHLSDPNYASVGDVISEITDTNSDDRCQEILLHNAIYHSEVTKRVGSEAKLLPLTKTDAEEKFVELHHRSVKDFKRISQTETVPMNSLKANHLSLSSGSIIDPNYKSLSDVKNRGSEEIIREHLGMKENENRNTVLCKNAVKNSDLKIQFLGSENYSNSAIGVLSEVPKSPVTKSRIRSKSGNDVIPDDTGVTALTETAKRLTDLVAAVTDSGSSTDLRTGNTEEVYSKVRKKKSASLSAENLYSTVKKHLAQNTGSLFHIKSKPKVGQPVQSVSSTEKKPIVLYNKVCGGYDSDTELSLDPGYAECADAIKGTIPHSVYSDGSGSKMSSCTSLDMSAEDFVLEPGYAECADAIKSGAIKKVSVSHERLMEHAGFIKHDDVRLKSEPSSDIYANPQILLRKRSKLLEEAFEVGGIRDLFDEHEVKSTQHGTVIEANKPIDLTKKDNENLGNSSKKRRKMTSVGAEAPPLPARNYSLYLEGENADTTVTDVLLDCPNEVDDNAFETENIILNVDRRTYDDAAILSNSQLELGKDDKEINKQSETVIEEIVTEISHAKNAHNLEYTGQNLVNDDCLQVTVNYDQGISCVLTVIEKDESSNRKRMIKKSHAATKDDSNKEKGINENLGAQPAVETRDLMGLENTQTFIDITKDSGIINDVDIDKVNTSLFQSTNSFPQLDESANAIEKQNKESHANQLVHNYVKEMTSSETLYNLEKDTGRVAIPTYQTNEPVQYPGHYFLSNTPAVRMISFDSDSDICVVDDLPKLQISESDLVDTFDSSDFSADSVFNVCFENATLDQMTLNLINDCEVPLAYDKYSNVECDTGTNYISDHVAQEFCSQGKSDVNNMKLSPQNDLLLLSSDSALDISKVVRTENSDVKPVVSNISGNSPISLQTDIINPLSKRLQNLKFKDFSSEKKQNKNLKDNHYLCGILNCDSGCINDVDLIMEKTGLYKSTSDVNDEDCPSPEKLHIKYQHDHPELYEDNEPTHMSINEVLGHKHASFLDEVKLTNELEWFDSELQPLHDSIIPEDSLSFCTLPVNPPPRPPRPSHSISEGRLAGNIQTDSSTVNTPIEEALPHFRFDPETGLSCDESPPPAIPPRTQTKKTLSRPVSYSKDFMESMRQLKDCGWYWGPLSWEEALHKLANKPEGSFLVRDSSDEHYILSLSFKNQGKVHHTRIEHNKGHFSFWSQPDSHAKSTIKEFIEQCVENSRNGRFLYFIRPSGPGSPPMPIYLLHPVSRFVQMQSLQHICRFRILGMVRRDHIDMLPIPKRIKQYLKEAQYYVESLED